MRYTCAYSQKHSSHKREMDNAPTNCPTQNNDQKQILKLYKEEENYNIIKPKIKDSLEIAKLIKAGWNSAYKGIISDEDLYNMDVEKMAEKWKNNIESSSNIYIYKENDTILGVIRFGKAENVFTKKIGEIFCLYVKPEEKRKGIGTKLFNIAKNKLIEDGYDKMIIWCLKGNKQGENFYKKCGGNKIKERDYIVRGVKVKEEGFMFNLKDEEIVLTKLKIK